MSAAEQEYNGWTNWETWHTALLADNDEPLYRAARAMAQACLKYERKGQYDQAKAANGFKRCLHRAWMETKRFAAQNEREYGEGWKIEGVVNWDEVAAHFIDAERDEQAYLATKEA